MSALGLLAHAGQVEDAVVDRLRNWMPVYVAELERQTGRTVGRIPALKSIKSISDFDRRQEEQVPAAVVVSTGTTGTPIKEADGYYRATYNIGVAIVVAAREERGSREIAQLYGAAVRGCLLQRRSLTDVIEIGVWLGESFDELSVDDRRSMFGGMNLFEMEVRNIVSWKLGPPPSWVAPETPVDAEVPADPTDEIPGSHTATDITVEIETN